MDWYRHRSSWFIIYGVILERRTCKLALAAAAWSDVPYLLADHGIIRKSFFKRGNEVRGTRAYVHNRVRSFHERNIFGTQQHSRTRTSKQPRFDWRGRLRIEWRQCSKNIPCRFLEIYWSPGVWKFLTPCAVMTWYFLSFKYIQVQHRQNV